MLNEWRSITKVRDMGSFETIVTFESKAYMEEALATGTDFLLNYFAKVRQWTDEVIYQTRREWV